MEPLQFKVIKSTRQYNQYCKMLEELVVIGKKSAPERDAIELLQLLIAKWDEENNTFSEEDPVRVLRYLMKDHQMKSVDLSRMLGISTSLVSDILHYRRGLSKEIIRKLSAHFCVSQELFNRPYELKAPTKA
ncbi:helix-turn-helix domain-containing protein [Chitinophaga cymbidii]|uniref:HTH cro/C1-type domain-containing protein n=1 Tax=Chitinophaga cymbidii TaxID=1096750 RepID=A0A512RR37_9BACT|nr:helix-turn-helix domain-containing protein [Chitinophaga cymbidii]GEP98171.1 hypothetical protein CCY01nite_44310 [Chitinophaga cymbidii]